MVLVNITHRPEHISLTKQLQRDNPLDLVPCVGSGVVRIDTLCFMARCRTRRLTQAISVYILACFIVLLFIMAPLLCIRCHWYVFCLLVVLIKFQYLPSYWLERLL